MLRDIIEVLYTKHKGTIAEIHDIKIVTNNRVLYQGKANEVPDELLDGSWVIVSINQDNNLLNNSLYKDVPFYNLPTIINVI